MRKINHKKEGWKDSNDTINYADKNDRITTYEQTIERNKNKQGKKAVGKTTISSPKGKREYEGLRLHEGTCKT